MFFVNSFSLAVLLRKRTKIPISWTFIAPIPAVVGAIVFSYTKNPYWATLICITATMFIIYMERESLQKTLVFLRTYKSV
jgi:hypothetical protein